MIVLAGCAGWGLQRPQGTVGDAVKAVIIIVLQLMTSAVGTMAIARSAVLVRTPFARLRYDELHEEHEHHDE